MNTKQLKFGALLSYGTIVFNIASGLLYTPWLIRVVGDDHYALYTLALSIVNVFLLEFGIGSAVTKFLSNFYAQGKEEQIGPFLGIVYKTFFVISCLIALAMGIFYFQIDVIYKNITPENLIVFKRLFLIVAIYSVFSFPFNPFNGILMAGERFIELKCCSLFQKILEVAVIVLLLMRGSGVYTIVLTHAAANTVFLGIKYYLIRKKLRIQANFRHWNRNSARELFDYSTWFTVMSIARRCIYNIMPTVISALANSEAVVIFSLASSLEGYAFTLTDAINGLFMPHVSRIINSGNQAEGLQSLMIKVAKFHIDSLGLLVIGFICIGDQFVSLWMGSDYYLIYPCAIILLIPSMLETPQQIARTALMLNNIIKQQAILYIIMAGINLGLAYLLIPKLGVLGAGLSVSVSYLAKTIGLNLLYTRHLPISLGNYFRNAYSRWVPCAFLTLVFGVGIHVVVPGNGWISLMVKACCIAGGYLVLLFGIVLTKEERRKVLVWIRRKM